MTMLSEYPACASGDGGDVAIAVGPSRWPGAHRGRARARRLLRGPRAERHESSDVERRTREDEERIDMRGAAQLHLAQPGHRLEPPEGPLKTGARVLTQRVAEVSRGAG